MWVNHFTKLSFLQLIPTPFPALLSELFTSSAVPRFRSIALELKDKLLTSKIVAEVAIRKTINTNAISVVEKFQKEEEDC
ncbi:Uncharacterized protein TCM_041122 isoform 2 [Theobroma cacao]|uniref:Uncharacterized protein isoform 2 n=1 Tax=Theobroma cacao TaxID=3641 RepID=A0A061GTH2_THECC|nr:Uncharacterized protein TCM_041122 isoform 2 [Theobroma cacao]